MNSYQESKERERQVVMAAEQVRRAEERELQIVATREIEKFRERVSFVIRQVCTLPLFEAYCSLLNFTMILIFTAYYIIFLLF